MLKLRLICVFGVDLTGFSIYPEFFENKSVVFLSAMRLNP